LHTVARDACRATLCTSNSMYQCMTCHIWRDIVASTVLTPMCPLPGAPGCGLPAAAAAAVRGHGRAGRRARRGAARPGPRRGVAARLRAPAARPAHAGAHPRGPPSLARPRGPASHLRAPPSRLLGSPASRWRPACRRRKPAKPGARRPMRARAAGVRKHIRQGDGLLCCRREHLFFCACARRCRCW